MAEHFCAINYITKKSGNKHLEINLKLTILTIS